MLPSKRGIKRRFSVSKCEESSNLQSSSASGSLRKRSRLGKPSKVLGGGAVGGVYTSRFDWPYYPQLSDRLILVFLRRLSVPLSQCFSTGRGNDRNGLLTPAQIHTLDIDINRKIRKLHRWNHVDIGAHDMLDELMDLFRFANIFLVENITRDTSVRLNNKPFVDTLFEYGCPKILRFEDAFSNDPVFIRDWRPGSGGTRQNPRITQVSGARIRPYWDKGAEKDNFVVKFELPNRRQLYFRFQWFGPYTCLPYDIGLTVMPAWIDHIKDGKGNSYPDSLLVENPMTMQERMAIWLPYMRQLLETKRYGVYHRLSRERARFLIDLVEENFRLFDTVAIGHEATTEFHALFSQCMNRLRVVNLTQGSLVLLRTTQSSHAFRYHHVDYIQLYPVDILAAELHFPKRGEVHQITKEMVNAYRVEDFLEVKISLSEKNYVILKIDWLGPTTYADNGIRWESFLGVTSQRELLASDRERSRWHSQRRVLEGYLDNINPLAGSKLLTWLQKNEQ